MFRNKTTLLYQVAPCLCSQANPLGKMRRQQWCKKRCSLSPSGKNNGTNFGVFAFILPLPPTPLTKLSRGLLPKQLTQNSPLLARDERIGGEAKLIYSVEKRCGSRCWIPCAGQRKCGEYLGKKSTYYPPIPQELSTNSPFPQYLLISPNYFPTNCL